MRKTSRSRSFGMPSAPREGSLPPKICLWNIKYRIHYNRIQYADFPGVSLGHWVNIFGVILVKSVSYKKYLWNTICNETICKYLNIFLQFDVKYCLHLNLSLSTKYRNSHFHRKYPPFLNPLEWLTLSCLRGKHHLLLVLLSTTWDQVHEILYHRLSKSRSPGIIQLKEYNLGENFNCSCTSWGRINAQ